MRGSEIRSKSFLFHDCTSPTMWDNSVEHYFKSKFEDKNIVIEHTDVCTLGDRILKSIIFRVEV